MIELKPSVVSKTPRRGSTLASEQRDTDSVFDFLYIDTARLGSFYAQTSGRGYGHVTAVSRGDEVNSSHGGAASVEADVLVAGMKGDVNAQRGATNSVTTSYDPTWAAARAVLDKLSELGFIGRGIDGAEVGELRVCSGSLTVLDLGFMRLFAELASASGDFQQQVKRGRMVVNVPKSQEQKMWAKIFQGLPYAVQGQVATPDGDVWFTMDMDKMTRAPEQFSLMHGSNIPGVWHVLGIVDAVPQSEKPDNEEASPSLHQGARMMASAYQQLLGRSAETYGITPLLLFREITQPRQPASPPFSDHP